MNRIIVGAILVILAGVIYFLFFRGPLPPTPAPSDFETQVALMRPAWHQNGLPENYMHTNIEALAQLPLARLNTIERELNAFQTQNVQAQELKGVYLSLVHTFQANAQYDLIVSELKQAQGFCANVSKYDQAAQWAKTLSNESVTFESKANEFATAYPVESAAIQFNALGSTLTISKQETEEQIALLDAFKGLCESELA